METVTTGLLAGSIPLVAGIVLSRLNLRCDTAGAAPYCTAFSALIGVSAGAVIAVREARGRPRFWGWLMAATIAVLAASLGCLRLGVAGIASVVLGIAMGSVAAATFTKRSR
jgi:hypothetical protein